MSQASSLKKVAKRKKVSNKISTICENSSFYLSENSQTEAAKNILESFSEGITKDDFGQTQSLKPTRFQKRLNQFHDWSE